MESNQLQQEFFSYLKSTLPPHISLADELIDLLDISADSAYRRLRGEKPLTLSELKLICERYNISMDQVLNLQSDTVAFRAHDLVADYKTFAEYLNSIHSGIKFFLPFKKKKIMYLCKDAPLWCFYLFPELAAFKTYFFQRSLRNDSSLIHRKFSFKEMSFEDCFAIGKDILKTINEIPCEELWNNESWNSTINKIAYYQEAGLFQTREDFDLVIHSLLKTIDHLEQQAIVGRKFMPGGTELTHRATIEYYVNDLIIGNNTIYGEVDGNKISWVTYSVLNILFTKHQRFNEHLFSSFNTLKSRSALVSVTGEKERVKFFNSIREKVNALKK